MVKETHAAIFAAENGYRGFQFTLEQALDDTIEVAALISQINMKGGIADERAKVILNGISRIESHLIGDPYRIDNARVSAAKAACLATILKQDGIAQTPANIRFDSSRIAELADATIESRPVLDRLKAISPEAFFYWVISESLMEHE